MSKPTLEQLAEAASEHSTRSQFKEAHPRWYKHAWRRGVLDEICGHMSDARIKWTRDRLVETAKKYETRSEFKKMDPNAYDAARYRGWLNYVCQHMETTQDTIYLCRVVGTNIFKLGVTTEALGMERIETLQKKSKQPLELVLYAPIGGICRILETRLLLIGVPATVEGVKSTEFREYTDQDLWKVMQLLFTRITEANELIQPQNLGETVPEP